MTATTTAAATTTTHNDFLARLGAKDGEARRELRAALAPLLRRYPCADIRDRGAPAGAAAKEINRLRLASALASASALVGRRRSRPVFADPAPAVAEAPRRTRVYVPKQGIFDGGTKTNNRCARVGRGKRHQNAAVRATPARGAGRQAKWAPSRPARNHKARL